MVKEILKIRIDNGAGNNDPTFKDIELSEYSAKFPRMGFPELSATLMWPAPLDDEWTHKEYVVLRGEKFYVTDTPDAEKTNDKIPYKHDLGFTSEFARILGNTYFEDAVPSYSATYDKPCSNSSKFTFYGTIAEFCDRLNCSFIKAGIADSILKTKTSLSTLDRPVGDGYCVMLDPYGADNIYDPDKSYEFSWEDKTHWEAITEGFNITEIPFERRGKCVIFGALPKVVDHKFEYGHDNELLSVKHKNAKAKVVNRITMQGSSENIPYYYPNETEYGHISLVADNGNNIITDSMLEISNMTQLLSRLNADTSAILCKYGADDSTSQSGKAGKVSVVGYQVGYGPEYNNPESAGYIGAYTSQELRKTGNIIGEYCDWHIKVRFDVIESGIVNISKVLLRTWVVNESQEGEYSNVIEQIIPEKFWTPADSEGKYPEVDFTDRVLKTDEYVSLGNLPKGGTYFFQFCVRIPIKNNQIDIQFFRLKEVYFDNITSSSKPKTGYYWKVGDKKYDGIGALGITLNVDVTDAMLGDGFGWEVSERMNFQTNLVPPKYRNTLGTERFYNALNAPYSEEYASEHPDAYLDPDTNNPYVFPNPFIEGAPSEHIYKNEDIKPTIEGVTNANGQLLGVIADIAYDADDNDALKTDSTEDNDKNDALKYEHSFFYIKLNIFNGDYGFDLFKHASQTDAMTIQMRDGSCNGCKFKIQAAKFTDETGLESYRNPIIVQDGKAVGVVSEDGIKESDLDPTQQNTQTHSIWICVQKDASTFGVIMPNKSNDFKPKIGDKFNIINIDLPESYIRAAEKRLEEEGMRYMLDNNEEKFTFDIQVSRIFVAENPDVFDDLDEYSKIKIKYNGREYEQYVNQISMDCKSNEALPNYGIDLTDTLAVGQSFVEQVAERASSLISNPYTMGGALGGGSSSGGGLTTRLADQRYLKKTENDRSYGKIASNLGFEVGEFVSGGSGGIFYQDPETGQTYIEADKLKVRMKAIFEELEIAKVSTIGGKFIITPGGGLTISFVEELDNSYRCYFKAEEDGKKAECRIIGGDFVQCMEFSTGTGQDKNIATRYYWRLVTAVNNEECYIVLSKSYRDTSYDIPSDAPQAGDTIVQLGNVYSSHKERQSAIILSTIDEFAPCVTLYNGINSFSLKDKAVVEYGVDKSNGKVEPFFNCYGRFFFGPKGGDSYLKFEPSVGKLIFSGELINISTLNGQNIDDYIKGVVPPVTQEDIEEYVNAIVDPRIEGIQNQIDGVVESFFGFGAPTLTNYPANEWTTDEERIAHNLDTYTDRTEYVDNETTPTAGQSWRWLYTSPTDYRWVKIADSDATRALLDAAKAQDTADQKRRTFISIPKPPYNKGDLWVNATYPSVITADSRNPNLNRYYLDILRCKVDKETGNFAISDWELASNYSDDTKANQAIEEIGGFQYIRDALVNGATIFNGGLILSQLIKLGTWDKNNPSDPTQKAVYAGMNGDYLHAKTIASWWGGDMVDKYYNDSVTPLTTPLTTGYANALVRMDGTGYFCGGNVRFEKNYAIFGSEDKGVKIGTDGTFTVGSGVEFNVSNINGLQATLNNLANFNAALGNLFLVIDNNDDEYDLSYAFTNLSNVKAIKARKGFFSDSFISARGVSANGDSGSGGGATQLRALDDVLIGNNLASGQSLVYNGSKWVNQKVGLDTTELSDYLTTNNYAKKTDIPSLTNYATKTWVENKGYLTSVAWGDVTGKPTWIGSSKPSYAFSEITGKPTTLAGYGITDAYDMETSDGRFLGKNANAASATKLSANTPYTAWGQTFFKNGVPHSISGNLTDVGSITASDSIISTAENGFRINATDYGLIIRNDNNNSYLLLTGQGDPTGSYNDFRPLTIKNDTGDVGISNNTIRVLRNGLVGIGIVSPAFLLDVNGEACVRTKLTIGTSTSSGSIEIFHSTPYIDFHYGRTTEDYTTRLVEEAKGRLAVLGTLRVSVGMYSNGYISARGQNTSSDENLKHLERRFAIDVKKIANAPSWCFKWKSDGKDDVGSLAQYWERINPLLTPKIADGTLTLQYGKTALLGLISVAKKTVSHEEEIKHLKEEVNRLKKRIARLERK